MKDPILLYPAWLLIASLIALFLYWADKRKAKRGKWRTPEAVLLGISLLGGGYGGYAAMFLFHHKTKHWYFHAVNLLSILLHTAALIALLIQRQ